VTAPTPPLTDEQVAEIRARVDAATEGPWIPEVYPDGRAWVNHETGESLFSLHGFPADAEFIAHARTDVELLLADRARLTERLAEVEAAVPPGPCWHDSGITWPDGFRPRCELRAGHAGAHECDRGAMGGTAVWLETTLTEHATPSDPPQGEGPCSACGSSDPACESSDGGCCDVCRATGGCSHGPAPASADTGQGELTREQQLLWDIFGKHDESAPSDRAALTESEREALIVSLLDPTDDCAHNFVPMFAAVERILSDRVAAERDDRQAATWDGWTAKVRDLEAEVERLRAVVAAVEWLTSPVSDYSAAVDPEATGKVSGRESGDLEEGK
jgi:hypothetical protein